MNADISQLLPDWGNFVYFLSDTTRYGPFDSVAKETKRKSLGKVCDELPIGGVFFLETRMNVQIDNKTRHELYCYLKVRDNLSNPLHSWLWHNERGPSLLTWQSYETHDGRIVIEPGACQYWLWGIYCDEESVREMSTVKPEHRTHFHGILCAKFPGNKDEQFKKAAR